MPGMKVDYLTKTFSWLLMTLGPAFAIALNFVLFGNLYHSDIRVFLLATSCTLLAGLLLSRLHIGLSSWLRKKVGARPNFSQRLFAQIFFMLITATFVTAIFFGYEWIDFPGYNLKMENYKWALLTGLTADLVGSAFNEAIYSQKEWRRTQLEKEQLEKLHLQSQLDVLKNQINPHFLFNSLNSLSSLIAEDPENAERFVDKLSAVYRYILLHNDRNWVDLQTELSFIEAYFHLLQTRHGNGVQLRIDVSASQLKMLLPPLTLQILVENAVKHNVVHKNNPLIIQIASATETLLIVSNNLQQKKKHFVVSNGVGLKNIAERYSIANAGKIVVEEEAGLFTVRLPLLHYC
ncbi:MAG: sensor histidine kinase [Agriterribacter sp.]